MLYSEAISNLSKMKFNKEGLDLQKTCFLNMSVATNSLGRYKDTIAFCTKALNIDNTAAKGYYLRSIASSKTKGFDEAINDIKEAIKLSPGDKNLRDEFESIKFLKQKDLKAQ